MIATVLANVSIGISWLVFSFLFWRMLRREGIDETRIFDLTLYASLCTFIVARIGFVLMHPELFGQKSPLLIAAIWVTPGLSFVAGLVGGVATLTFLSRQYKVRLGIILDAVSLSLPFPIIIALVGRLPRTVYDLIVMLCISGILYKISLYAVKKKLAYGIVGVWFFLMYSVCGFLLEFFNPTRVYWGSITANQWILIGIFAESVGVLYVRGGGRERLRPIVHYIYESISKRYRR